MSDEPIAVVLAEKRCFKGQIHAAAQNGGAIINISGGIAIKFIAENDKFVTVQVLTSGIGKPIKNQSWVKSKVSKKSVQSKIKVGEGFKPTEEVKKRDIL